MSMPRAHRFGQLQSVNTESVEPALQAAIKNESNMLRPDTVQEFEQRCTSHELLVLHRVRMQGGDARIHSSTAECAGIAS